MKKQLLKTFRLQFMLLVALLCSLATSTAWADETIELTYENFTNTSYNTSENTFTETVSFGYVNAMRNGSNGTPSGWAKNQVIQTKSGSTIYNKAEIAGLKNIRVYTVANTNSFTITTGKSAQPTTNSVTRPSTPTGSTSITYSSYANKKVTEGQTTTANYYDFAVASGDNYFKIAPGGSLYIWKIVLTYENVSVTSLSVGTAPTKTNYKKGETLDLTGLVLDADGDDVNSGYTASPANGATLNTVGAQTVTFTYGGQTTTQTIHVGDLESIALTTTGVKTTYDEGQTFNPENLVVTATYSDGETTATTWTESVDLGDCSFDPDDALETTDDNVEVSYTWGSKTKTANIAITVNEASAYTVTFNKGTGTCATNSLTEASAKAGVTLPTATIGVTGWSFAGWATEAVTNTEDEPTLYDAGDTYNPTENCTLYAVYKFIDGTEDEFIRATSLSEVKAASQVILVNGGKTLTTDLSAKDALSESESVVTAADKTVFTLSGNDTDGYVLSSASGKIGASSLPTSNGNYQDLAITNTNSTWSITTNSTTNTFTFLNKGGTNVGLEYYSTGSKWVVYKTSSPTTSSYYSTKVYIPNWNTVYNSNPAAIVDPTIAWTTSGDKSLYLQNTKTYNNAANVTGISKTPTYTSSDATVASISPAGEVTALKAGTTTIKATVEAETGVNTKAEISYEVTVKDASNVAGIKAITSSSTVVTFTADLTDAVVTYVNGNHAYIQDASGAIYASCGSSLTAGKKINGAVSGSVKAANQIDEITAIILTSATVTDGVIPSAAVISAATLAANKADYEGKLVSIEGATVTASLTSGSASGGKISDDSKVTEINLYAPDSNIDALRDAEGTFNGYISLYNGGLRFNIYEQSQITLTKNAPTAQTLTFASDAVELDEDTDDIDDFAGQEVSGAQGTVTYSVDSDASGVVTSINASTGAVVLSGNRGTATIKASAAAKEVENAGVTTPYTATTKSYTITVHPRYTVTFSANGVETPVRQASHGAPVAVPSPSDVSGFKFMGWSTSTVDLTDDAPSMESLSSTVTPTDDATYYAVYAVQKSPASDGSYSLEYGVDSFTPDGYGKDVDVTANDGSSWVVRAYDNSGIQINSSKDASIKLPTCPNNITTIVVTCSSNNNFSFGTTSKGDAVATPTNNTIDLTSESYTTGYINPSSGVNVITKIVVNYGIPAVYNNYCTTVPAHVNIASAVGYTTYVATDNVSFPSGAKAYIATQVNASTIHMEKVLAVPEGTAVVVEGDKGVYILNVVDAGECNNVSGNKLLASDGSVTGDGSTIYALGVGKTEPNKGVVGFYVVNDGQTVPAGKAYINTGSPVHEFLNFSFDDTETGINSIENGKLTIDNYYDLSGRRVVKPTKGLYIVNGKKVFIKK